MSNHNYKTVGIGKMMLKKKINNKGNIPYLHFIVEKNKDDNEYIAINLELLVTASGDTVNEAIANLSHITLSYINDVLQVSGYAGLIELAKSSAMEHYWAKYRELEFMAAEYGQDLGHTIDEDIQSRLLRAIGDKAIEKAADCLSKEMVEILRDIFSLSVSYTEIEAA